MTRTGLKRRLSSWVLLSVFLPMLVLTALHQHHVEADANAACVQCLNHLPHAGHFSAQTDNLHDCVLCQFVSLPYLLPVAFVLAVVLSFHRTGTLFRAAFCPVPCVGSHSSRAPPSF